VDTARRADGTFDEAFLAELRTALHGIGFLQLTGYGASPGQLGALTAAAARFFALPLQERLRLDNRLSPHFRGYTRLGHEITAGRPDAREQIDFAPERAPVPRELWDAPDRLLEGPNQCPTTPSPSSGRW
jgi:isopenicillin N synthase-like dioxygenase